MRTKNNHLHIKLILVTGLALLVHGGNSARCENTNESIKRSSLTPDNVTQAKSMPSQEHEKKIHDELAAFKKTDEIVHLQNAAHLIVPLFNTIEDRFDSPKAESTIKLILTIIQECYNARDHKYDLKAPHNVFTCVMPPVGSAHVVVSGMDPKEIKDPVARKQYEQAIEENNQRKNKLHRELVLERALEFAIAQETICFRGWSDAQEHIREIITKQLTDVTLRDRVLKELQQQKPSQ